MKPQIKDVVYLAGLAVSGLFWLFTMHGLPPRVERLEITTRELQKRIDRNDIKTDIILDDVKTIKNFLLQRHGGE